MVFYFPERLQHGM